ncbi:MAG TPA: amidoligase family protein [Kofleriaceae bacterium]|nr:amidoligase family protein [Kofleriaceae bacterium]
MESVRASLDPPVRVDARGRTRVVGVEIELTGMEVGAIVDTVARVFGGAVARETDYLARVATELGEFRVEVDLHLLQRIGKSRAQPSGDTGVVAALRDAVAAVAERIAPFEVVTPPLPYPALPRVDDLVDSLAAAGGRGTGAGLLHALGLHLNPDVPEPTAPRIHATVRAYAILEPWLRARAGVDVSRRLTPFVDPYPAAYVQRLVEQEVAPPMERLIDDYLRYNPTRNRGLDLLPLLSSIDRERVEAAVSDPRVKSRPTYHYRLPDSRVGEPGWQVTDEWRRWLVVEEVAASPPRLARLAEAYAGTLRGASAASAQGEWAERCEALL